MAYNKRILKYDGEFTSLQKKHLIDTLDEIEAEIAAGGAFTPQAAPTALTINTGGTPGNTLAAMTVTTPADLAAVAAQLVIIQNSINSVATKINQLRTELVDSGLLTA